MRRSFLGEGVLRRCRTRPLRGDSPRVLRGLWAVPRVRVQDGQAGVSVRGRRVTQIVRVGLLRVELIGRNELWPDPSRG